MAVLVRSLSSLRSLIFIGIATILILYLQVQQLIVASSEILWGNPRYFRANVYWHQQYSLWCESVFEVCDKDFVSSSPQTSTVKCL